MDNGKYTKNLACLFLTHNHPETVKEVLKWNAVFYEKYDIDIYFCDDSDGVETRDVIEEYRAQGFTNVYWADAEGAKDGNDKYLRALRGDYFTGDGTLYKYVFPIKDRVIFTENVIEEISEKVLTDRDLIMVVNDSDRWELVCPPVRKEYEDPALFFKHYGKLVTNWRTMIFSTETFSKEWLNSCIKKYGLGCGSNFVQPIITFDRLAEPGKGKVSVIRVKDGDVGEIYDQGARSSWEKNMFEIWVDNWIKAVFSLPGIYDAHKAEVLKSQTNDMFLFGSVDALLYQRKSGILTKEVFSRYRPM